MGLLCPKCAQPHYYFCPYSVLSVFAPTLSVSNEQQRSVPILTWVLSNQRYVLNKVDFSSSGNCHFHVQLFNRDVERINISENQHQRDVKWVERVVHTQFFWLNMNMTMLLPLKSIDSRLPLVPERGTVWWHVYRKDITGRYKHSRIMGIVWTVSSSFSGGVAGPTQEELDKPSWGDLANPAFFNPAPQGTLPCMF